MRRYDTIMEIGKADRYDHIVEVEKFNPYHDSRGRFASASGSMAVGMGVDGYAGGGIQAAIADTLRDAEKKNMGLDHEVATIVNPSNGKVLFAKEGGAAGVSFNSSEAREISRKILTHNHPDNLIFSPTDVAMSYHLKSIRATTPEGDVYELSGMNRRDAINAYRDHYMAARAESFKKLGIPEGTLDRDLQGEQRTGSFSHISESCHKWLTDNAGKYRYQYTKGRIEE